MALPALIIGSLVGGLAQAAASLTGRVLMAIGIGYVTYTGFDAAVGGIYAQIKGGFNGMPAEIVAFLGWCWVDKAIGMIFSAYTAALGIRMAGGTSLTKMVIKK